MPKAMTTISPDKITIELGIGWGGIDDWKTLTTALVEALRRATSDSDFPFAEAHVGAISSLLEELIAFELDDKEPLPKRIGKATYLPIRQRLAL